MLRQVGRARREKDIDLRANIHSRTSQREYPHENALY